MDNTSAQESQGFLPLLPGFFAGRVAAKLDHTGLPIPLNYLPRPVVIVLDDRTPVVKLAKERRFPEEPLREVLRACRTVTIACYWNTAVGKHRRLGEPNQDEAHRQAVWRSLSEGGIAVFVRTTNDRVKHWIGKSRYWSMGEAEVRVLDASGAFRIENEWPA
jgi:hypothetical protein